MLVCCAALLSTVLSGSLCATLSRSFTGTPALISRLCWCPVAGCLLSRWLGRSLLPRLLARRLSAWRLSNVSWVVNVGFRWLGCCCCPVAGCLLSRLLGRSSCAAWASSGMPVLLEGVWCLVCCVAVLLPAVCPLGCWFAACVLSIGFSKNVYPSHICCAVCALPRLLLERLPCRSSDVWVVMLLSLAGCFLPRCSVAGCVLSRLLEECLSSWKQSNAWWVDVLVVDAQLVCCLGFCGNDCPVAGSADV